jgi:L-aminopeptidase/D-esterase-like protein
MRCWLLLLACAVGAGGETILEFDFPAVRIGVAEYEEGPTGATVFYFPDYVMAVVDVRGSAPGTILTDAIRQGSEVRSVSAISFAGGAAYGLAAATGVAYELRDTRPFSIDWGGFPVVPGAVIWDLAPRRLTTISPDESLGRAALRNAVAGRFPQGAHGAGRFACHSSYFGALRYSGQGGAFRQTGSTKVAVFTVVNAVGTVVNRAGQVVRCSNDPDSGPCGAISDWLARAVARAAPTTGPPDAGGATRNTTITLVVVNRKLAYRDLQRLAIQVHSSMARAIQPFNVENDGDTLFAVSTGEVADASMSSVNLGVLASETAWDAVLNSVPQLDPIDKKPVAADPAALAKYAGRYEFAPETALAITQSGGQIWGEAIGKRPVYAFVPNRKLELAATASGVFFVKTWPETRVRFTADGLIVNPGHWPLKARRVR